MNPTNPVPISNPTGKAPRRLDNPLQVMSPGEQIVCQIDRHPFGLIGLYLSAGMIIVLVVAGAILAPHYVTGLTSSAKTGFLLIALIVAVITGLYLYIAATIYNGNHWVVSSDSITQISQVGLFRKQTSQLSLANLEDVTFEQNSLIQTMLGFGTLRVETAGERSKFAFPYCPRPQECAKQIIKAHEDFIQAHPEEGQTASPGTYGQAQAASPQYQQQPVYQQPMPQQPYVPSPKQTPQYAAPADPTEQTQQPYAQPGPDQGTWQQPNDPTQQS